MDIASSVEWHTLSLHHKKLSNFQIADAFASDPNRFTKFSLKSCGILLDYSKNRITSETLQLLLKLAETANLSSHIEAMFSGKIINTSENRAVLHTALRNPNHEPILSNEENIIPEIHKVLAAMKECATSIRSGKWLGYTNKMITDIVSIGIGGSHLGPAMVTKALAPYTINSLKFHFVSNIDGAALAETLKNLNTETTLFIIASKTFTTIETLTNAKTAKTWLSANSANSTEIVKRHFIAVTANSKRAIEFGIQPKNIFPFWDWVGGRFSLWSAIGLSIAIAIGVDNFRDLLNGAFAMDQHFRHSPLLQNMPVILALISIWNINFLQTKAQAIVPYDQYLELFPNYLQQLAMESNGKQVTVDGAPITYATAPVIFGTVGTNGQHAFHQALMQGMQLIPVDFIIAKQRQKSINENQFDDNHLTLIANCLAQSKALMNGVTEAEIIQDLLKTGLDEVAAKKLAPHKVILGNVPSNTILLDKLTPQTLGSLLALYEHQIFVQGTIWQINSFDQWGVELGKQLANQILPLLQNKPSDTYLDSSTENLIKICAVKC